MWLIRVLCRSARHLRSRFGGGGGRRPRRPARAALCRRRPSRAGAWESCGGLLRLVSSVGRSSPAAAAPNSAMAASSLSTKPTEWYVSPMSLSHQRKKQPELVRRSLIDCAARIVAEAGVGGATIQAVADAAGARAEERRGGKECVRPGKTRGSPRNSKNKT